MGRQIYVSQSYTNGIHLQTGRQYLGHSMPPERHSFENGLTVFSVCCQPILLIIGISYRLVSNIASTSLLLTGNFKLKLLLLYIYKLKLIKKIKNNSFHDK